VDTEILVESRIVDGQKLIRELSRSGFEVSVAFWVRLSESEVWILYIGSRSVSPDKPGEEYATLYTCLNRIPEVSIGLSEIYVIPFSDPIARAAIAIRDCNRKRNPARYEGKRLGNLDIEEAWIYPEPLPWSVRQDPTGRWQVLLSEAENLWLDCQSEEEARVIAAAPVLEHQVLSQAASGPKFAAELRKTAELMAKYRLGFGSRFFRWGAEEAEKSEDGRP
jgi:hypothetical protein